MIQQTQDQWMESNYIASSYKGGIDFPDYRKLAEAFDLEYYEITSNDALRDNISSILTQDRGLLCNIIISDKMRVTPQVKAGYPNEQLEPLLPNDLFKNQMIVPPTC